MTTRIKINELPPIIGVAGPARSGKDTIAKWLVDNYAYCRYSMAAPLKRGIREMLNLSYRETDGKLKDEVLTGDVAELQRTPRHLMQTLGTEWGRECVHPNIWVIVAKANTRHNLLTVVPDIRFENEAAWIRERGVLWHVTRDSELLTPVEGHSSEDGVRRLPGEPLIHNNGSRKTLHNVIDGLLEMHRQQGTRQENVAWPA